MAPSRKPYETPSLSAGTFALLLTDVEGSTAIWEAQPSAMRAAIQAHDKLLNAAIQKHGGEVLTDRGEGDSFFAVFSRPSEALAAAVDAQLALSAESWPTASALRVRMAIHTAEASEDYRGPDVSRCARLRSLALGGQILVSEPAAELAARALPAEVQLVDLGPTLLRDFPTPIKVFEVDHPRLIGPIGLPNRRTALPVQLRRFIGREAEREDLYKRLQAHRLITLVGPGGIGKTSLALEVASRLAADYRVVMIDLAPISDPGLVVSGLVRAAGLRDLPGRDPMEVLEESLGSATTLIFLDNCEHVLSAVADTARSLLESVPSLRVIATSREALGITGELRHIVLPLQRGEAVQLFRERASEANPGYEPDADDLARIGSIADRLDGMPLALELAAARLGATTLAQLVNHLDYAIQSPPRKEGAAARHETMRGALEWSYRLLTIPERLLLSRLSIFNAGFRLDAAQRVCGFRGIGVDSVFELLVSLVDRSFVTADLARLDPRYRLLEPVRQFATLLVRANESGALQDKLLDWGTAFVMSHHGGLLIGDSAAIEAVKEEIGNLTAVLETATGKRSGNALAMAVLLEPYWTATGGVREAIALIQRLLTHHPGLDARRAAGLRSVGDLKQVIAFPGFGVEACREALSVYEQLKMPAEVAETRLSLSSILASAGDLAALDGWAATIEYIRSIGDRAQLARALHRRATCARLLGVAADDEIRRGLEESLTIAGEDNNWSRIVRVEAERAHLAIAKGDVEEAAGHLKSSALAIPGETTRREERWAWLVAAVPLAMAIGRWDTALEYLAALNVGAGDLFNLTPLDAFAEQRDIAIARANLSPAVADAAWSRGESTPIESIIGGPDAAAPPWLEEVSRNLSVREST